MPPEQILGTGLSAASDLFSVGAVAYELFCLQSPAPTEGTIHDVLRAVLTHEPDQVDQIHHPAQGYVPSEFYVTIMRAVRRDPLERPQSAQEMMIMLQRSLDGHIDVVCPRTRIKSTLAHFSRWIDRDPYKSVPYFYLTLFFIIVLFVAIGVMIGALVF
jgi:serine/threonine protein kinase